MMTRNTRLTVCGAALLALTMTATTYATFGASRTTFLRFSGAVALPGVTLPAGTYTFEIANPQSTGDIVLVRTRATSQVKFLGFTHRVERPATLAKDQLIRLGEAVRGEPAPIVAWYPADGQGYAFIYR
jgi:hypothetical protein